MEILKIKLDSKAITPTRAYKNDAGLDLYTYKNLYVKGKSSVIIDTGVHVEIPSGYYGRITSKSGLNFKFNIISDGTIDSGYSGSIKVKLYNLGYKSYKFKKGDKISQLIIEKCELPTVEIVDFIESGDRGSNGFGSTSI